MVGHALWFDKCSSHFHEDDGQYPTTIHQYFVVVYLDDILIYNKTWVEHLQHIQQVLHTLLTAQAIRQLGKMLLWHGQGPLPGLHH
jgi:hypothetical protein